MKRAKSCRSRPLRAVVFVLAITAVLTVALFASAGATQGPVCPPAQTAGHAPDRFIVKFTLGTPGEVVRAINATNAVAQLQEIDRIGVRVLAVPRGKTVQEMVDRYARNPNVEFAEPDYLWEADVIPNDPGWSRQTQSARIGLPSAWDVTSGSPDVIIAILDSGVDLTHPDLAGRFVTGYDFGCGDSDPTDVYGHGTAVAGVAAETGNNGIGFAGVNWTSPVLPVKVGDDSGTISSSAVAAGLVYAADRGARVVNMSFSGSTYSSTVAGAVDYAVSKGLFLCAAAGNTGAEAIRYPAALPGVVGVGSMSASAISTFSTYGQHVDVVAPGEGINTTCLTSSSPYGDRYFFFSGTSAAGPYVAGLASLLFSAQPSLTGWEVEAIIRSTSTDYGDPGWDKYYGWGCINAAAALAGMAPPVPPVTPDPPVDPVDPEDPVDPDDPGLPGGPGGPSDTTPPSVVMLLPADGATVSKTVVLRAEANDESGIDRVEFYANGTLVGSVSASPYVYTWNLRKLTGRYTIVARAFDVWGNQAESAPITVLIGEAKTPPPKR